MTRCQCCGRFCRQDALQEAGTMETWDEPGFSFWCCPSCYRKEMEIDR